nr:hypothetical protein [Tanacetum cinerariifolium]
FDDLYNKLRSLEIDVNGGLSYGSRSTTVALTHSAFIGAASTNTKMVYSDQPSYSFLISYTPIPSGSIMKDVLHSFVAENEPTQQLAYEDFEQLGHFARECNVKKVDEKARYSAFKISEVQTEEPKAMVSVDSMLNWNEHDVENKTEEAEQVYGLMAGFESDFAVPTGNAAGGVNHAAVEFAMMGNSPKNVKPPRNVCNKSRIADRIPCKNTFVRPKKYFVCGSKSHLIKDCNVHDTVYNFPSVVSKAAYVPAGSRNSSTSISAGRSIPAVSRNRSASIYVGRSIPAASRNRSASIHVGRSIPAASRNKPASIHAGNYFPAGSSVPTDLICNGVPRTMVDLINLHGFALNDPQGRLKVSITNPHSKTPYELLSGKVPNIRHLKPFGCQVTILNTSDHLGKFEGKANDGFLVGYVAHSTQADDSECECDEQVILVPSFPSKSFSGPTAHDVSAPMENNLDYAAELARLQPEIKIRRNLVPAAGDPAGSVVSTGGVPAGGVPASGVPAGSVPASSVPAGGVLAGSIVSAEFGDLAARASVPAVFTNAPAATSPLPPDVAVDPVATKSVNTIHPPSQIIGALQSPVQTRSTVQKSKFGKSSFISYVHDQNRTNHADHLHCLFACFLSQLEPSSVTKSLEDPDWVAAIQEEMQQFYHQQEEGIDYDEVFALVARIEATRLFLACASYMGLMVYQMTSKVPSSMGKLKKRFKQLPDGIFISQDKYVKDMLKTFDMERVRTATTPYEVPKHKSKDDPDDAVNVHLFRSMIGSLMYLTASRPDIMFACKKQTVVAISSTKAEYVAAASCCGQVFVYILLYFLLILSYRMNAVSCGLLLYFVLNVSGYPKLQVVQLLVHADEFVPAGRCTITTISSSFFMLDWYALTHRPTIVFDSLVKQFWATATVRTLEAGPSDIITTIDGNEVVVSESLIRTQLQLDDVNGLYEFTLHDVLD